MNHPGLESHVPYAVQPLHLADECGRPLLVVVVKATCAIPSVGHPTLMATQAPVDLSGTWWGEPGRSSPRTEAESAFIKPATDVVLIGHAYAPRTGCTRMEVHCSVGSLSTTLRISGDRVWQKGWFGRRIPEPQPFERMPLTYERAFGGVDQLRDGPAGQVVEPGNPVGCGFRHPRSRFTDGVRLPNIEDPTDVVVAWGRRVTVAGVGVLAPSWQPRRALAGTFDGHWHRQRARLLPRDFDRRFFNAAHPRLISRDGHLRGDEAVCIRGTVPAGELVFQLPRLAAPAVIVVRRGTLDTFLAMALDTVLIDTDAMCLSLLWRGHVRLLDHPLEVSSIVVDQAGTQPSPVLVR